MIPNPTPVTASTFSGMWIQHLNIHIGGVLRARLLPYDGASNLLATGERTVTRMLPSNEPLLNAMLTTITAEVQRLANTDRPVRMITVYAPDPSKPVNCTVMFASGAPHCIPDCFALAAEDSTFAVALNSTMGEIARLAGIV